MKLTIACIASFASVVLASAALAADEPLAPLFHSGEIGISVFGEAANGNVSVDPTQTVTHTTTSTTSGAGVHGPTVPTPPPSPTPPQDELKKAFVKSTTTTRRNSDGSVTTTRKTTRVTSHDRNLHNAFGGGVRLEYFLSRYIGFALEGDFLGGEDYNTLAMADLIFRYPFEFGAKTETGYSKDGRDGKDGKGVVSGPTWGLAPYIIAGGGGQWDGRPSGIGAVGGGVELRFKGHYGIFAEGRWVIHDAKQNYATEVLGVTYTF